MSDVPSDFVPAPPRPPVGASLFFWLNMLLAGGLLGLVIASPFLRESVQSPLVSLFAQDSTVRKTALAGAVGLIVTAFVFFRSRFAGPVVPSTAHRPPPNNVVGA